MSHYPATRFAVAPMMEWTDRHCRVFHRQMTRRALLYTEMVTADAVIHGDRARLIGFSEEERPVALQLGGSDPARLAEAAAIGAAWGYDEIGLNCGCPSDRVQGGGFGACLMAGPALVARCVAAMKDAVAIPVTVKCRIGIDDQDPGPALDTFADHVHGAGADALWVHARKAWLEGLSPAENRTVPPLDHDRVRRLKARFPDWYVGINGGIETLDAAEALLADLDGVMLGRAAYQRPALLLGVDTRLHGDEAPAESAEAVARAMVPYVAARVAAGDRPHAVTRHMLGLFHGRPGARAFRRHLTERAVRPGADATVLEAAIARVEEAGAQAAARAAA